MGRVSDTRRRVPRPADEDENDPRAEDLEQFSGVTRTCPECRSEVYDEAEICWKCGHAFSGEPKPLPRWAVVVMVIVVLVLAGLAFPILRSLF